MDRKQFLKSLKDELKRIAAAIKEECDDLQKHCPDRYIGKAIYQAVMTYKYNDARVFYKVLDNQGNCWFYLLQNGSSPPSTYRDQFVPNLERIKNALLNQPIDMSFGMDNRDTYFQQVLMYISARYHESHIDLEHLATATSVEELNNELSTFRASSTAEISTTTKSLTDRIEYTRKDMLLVYHEMRSLKDRMDTLEEQLSEERAINEQLRRQLLENDTAHALAVQDLRKELLINNGSLVYIKNIKFSPEYDYEAIKSRNRKLHAELRKMWRIFMRGINLENIPVAIPVSEK